MEDELEGGIGMKSGQYCYWCGEPATSREHVPPKCLFPEDKDIRPVLNQSFREHLITVPSCYKHNLSKSNDDEYLMTCLAGKVGNNGVAYVHTKTKVARTIKRAPSLLDVKQEDILEFNDTKFPILMVKVENQRLINSFESIARALYFHEYSIQFKGKCMIISKIFIHPEDEKSKKFLIKSTTMIEQEIPYWKTEIKGYNPKIFTYQFNPKDDFGTQTIALTFYENTVIYAILSKFDKKKVDSLKTLYQVCDEVHIPNKFSGETMQIK